MSLAVRNLTCHEKFPLMKRPLTYWEMQLRKGMMKEATLLALSEGMELDQIPHHGDGTRGLGDLNPSSVLLSALFAAFVSHPEPLPSNLERCSLRRTPASAFSHRSQILLPQPVLFAESVYRAPQVAS